MKLGLIADIHANFPALEAVFSHGTDVDMWLCAGDIVGYYPDADEVCTLLRKRAIPTIRGNHDAYVSGVLEPHPLREPLYRTDWTRAALSADNLGWLAGLSATLDLRPDGVPVVVRHASLWDEETYIYPDSKAELARLISPDDGWLVLGHTHHPMVKPVGRGLVVNPGSVGQPRDGCPGACYAVIETRVGKVQLRRATYDISTYQAHLRTMGWPDANVDMLSRVKATHE